MDGSRIIRQTVSVQGNNETILVETYVDMTIEGNRANEFINNPNILNPEQLVAYYR